MRDGTNLVAEPDSLDLWCSGCDREVPIVAVITGNERCYYCGNEIPLCAECIERLKAQLAALEARG